MSPIPYGRQHIIQEDIDAVTEVLKSNYLTQGPKIREFEEKFAEYIGCKYAIAVSNGTAALHLAALALGVNKETRVITTPITFAASANCIRYCGGEVYFADIDKNSYLLNFQAVEELLKQKPKGFYQGLILVDFAGYPVNLEEFKSLADKYGLWIIEDACHAPGAYFSDSHGNKQGCGNSIFAEAAIFSFHPVKHIATGEGGMITTNQKHLYEKLLLLRTHGITKEPGLLKENHGGWYYEMQELGFNYRLTDIQAALGVSQLKRADAGLKKRQDIAARYDKSFHGTKIKTPQVSDRMNHAYHLYVIQVEDRLGLYDYLKKKNIYSQVHYIPVHLMPYYQKLGWKKDDFPVAEQFYSHCLSLPMYPFLSDQEQQYVIDKVIEFVK